MNQRTKDWLRLTPKEAIQWLDTVAPKNPLIGCDAGKNTNAVFVQIGKRLLAEMIISAAMAEKNMVKPQPYEPTKGDLLGKIIN